MADQIVPSSVAQTSDARSGSEAKTKSHAHMNKAECCAELGSSADVHELQGMNVPLSNLSLAELRALVQAKRIRAGTCKPRPVTDPFLQKIGKADLNELKTICVEKGIELDAGDRIADLRLKIRRWQANQSQTKKEKGDQNAQKEDGGFELVNP